MYIRKAIPNDSKLIAPLLLLAMEEVFYEFIDTDSYQVAESFLQSLVQLKGNQYSYENCYAVEINGKIAGVACVYDGAKLEFLKEKVAREIKSKFNRRFNPEDETEAGEVYIDCVAVSPDFQGRGIGSKLFEFLINQYVRKQKKTLGLLVDFENPQAKRLYSRLGFKVVGCRKLAGKIFEHMQIIPAP